MSELEVATITAADIQGAEQIPALVRGCEGADVEQLRSRYLQIGDILATNVSRLELDEDILQLTGFARCVGCQVIATEARAADIDACWRPALYRKHPPFLRKQGGRNMTWSEVRPPDRQQALMIRTLAAILGEKAAFKAGARAIIEFQDSQQLVTDADIIERE